MAAKFVLINDSRISMNSIKRYEPRAELKIKVYYNTSRYKIESEEFLLQSQDERDDLICKLDQMFLI